MAVNSIQNIGMREATQPSIMKKQNDITQEFVLNMYGSVEKVEPRNVNSIADSYIPSSGKDDSLNTYKP